MKKNLQIKKQEKMNKYLLLNFRNAKLFRRFNKNNENFRTKDYSINQYYDTYCKRHELPSFIEPITVYQISNMLHVLFNERPIPSLRESFYKRVDHYFEMAEKSLLKINTPKINFGQFPLETMHMKKSVWNSWNPNIPLNWELVRRYVDDEEKYLKFISILDLNVGINSKKIPFYRIKEIIATLDTETRLKINDSIVELKKCSGLIYALGRYSGNGKFSAQDDSKLVAKYVNCSAKTVNIWVEKNYNLSGEIIVPVSDDDIHRLEVTSKGFANLLDGGFVWIDSVKSGSEISDEGFTIVGSISTKMTTPVIST